MAVEIKKNEDLIKALGINTQASTEGVLNHLKALIERKSEDKKKFEKLYRFLDEHFEEDPVKIKDAFRESPLIFVPDTNNKYYRADKVLWKDVSKIFGENRAYLEKHYPELKKFFLEKLEIREKPIPKDYVDVLCSISEKSNMSDEDKEIIIKIYEELNRNLNPNKVENPISEEDWWEDFIKKPIFLIDRCKFWFNDGDIFINDDKELHELFKDEEDIGFLWLPEGYHPDKIKFFIKACNLRYLSEGVEIEPLLEETLSSKDDRLTQRIQTIIPYVLRYLYWKENAEYEKLKKNGIIEKIGAIEVYVTDNLKVRYSIKVNDRRINRESERKCIYHKDKNCIYMNRKGTIYDLAVELSKVFGEIRGFDDFIMNIMNNISNAENIMKAKNIELLPKTEEDVLKRIKEIETAEKAEKEIPLSELEEVYSVKEKIKTEKITQISTETLSQHLSELEKETGISEDILDKAKEEWIPEFSPEEVPIHIEEYIPKEERKMVISEEKKIVDKKPSTVRQISEIGRIQHIEALSKKAKEDIGQWGEKYAVYAIIKEKLKEYFNIEIENDSFKDILEHHGNIVEETDEGYQLKKDDSIIVKVIWLNKNGESGQHYDIKIIEITKNKEEFIEVKSTKEYEKAWFEVPKDQWRLMKEKGDKFYIYRVYGAGTKKSKIEKISNPVKLWKEGYIDAYPIIIEL